MQISDYSKLGDSLFFKNDENKMNEFFLEYLAFLTQDNCKALKDYFEKTMGERFRRDRPDREIVQGMLSVDIFQLNSDLQADNQKNKMCREKLLEYRRYYMCHANACVNVIKHIFSKNLYGLMSNMVKEATNPLYTLFINNYTNIISAIMADAEALLNNYSQLMHDTRRESDLMCIRLLVSPVEMIHSARSSMYGPVSAHAFSDICVMSSVASIREAIEIRIRSAFGLFSLEDPDGKRRPIDMSRILSCLSKYYQKKDIDFSIGFDELSKIYRWTNIFIHSGLRDYYWVPYFVEKQLQEFIFGKDDVGQEYNINNGIIVTNCSVIEDIRNEIVEDLDRNQGLKISQSLYRDYQCVFKQ